MINETINEMPKWKRNKKAYDKKWAKKNIESIIINVPKGKKSELKALAVRENTTVKGLFVELVQEKYGLSLAREKKTKTIC